MNTDGGRAELKVRNSKLKKGQSTFAKATADGRVYANGAKGRELKTADLR
jgi:hypothetical protein